MVRDIFDVNELIEALMVREKRMTYEHKLYIARIKSENKIKKIKPAKKAA
jgi:hypothetical protein